MQTIIGIVICLIIIVYFLIGFMDTYEGMVAQKSTASPTTTAVVANASGGIPLASVVEKVQKDTADLGSTIGIDINKKLYTDHIDNLLDYYDYQILNELANVTKNSRGVYDLSKINDYKKMKDALVDSQKFLELIT